MFLAYNGSMALMSRGAEEGKSVEILICITLMLASLGRRHKYRTRIDGEPSFDTSWRENAECDRGGIYDYDDREVMIAAIELRGELAQTLFISISHMFHSQTGNQKP